MKTVDAKRAYRRGCGLGLVLGVPLAALFASLWGGETFRATGLHEHATPRPDDLEHAIEAGLFGLAIGVGVGLAGAALIVASSSSEAREPLHEPEPTVEDRGLAHTFPGVFGTADPYEPFKRAIDAQEEEPAPAPPATMPEKCPECGQALEGEPVAFCYHCGGALG